MNERVARAHLVARVHLAHEPDFALGTIEVRPARREIVGEGVREIIDPRVMQVLVALARARGEILSRDDLIESCWDGVIVGEDAITRCISRLRSAAAAGGNAFSIETVPRVGYRLVTAEPAAPAPAILETTPSEFISSPAMRAPIFIEPMTWLKRSRGSAIAALIVVALGAGGTALAWFWPRPVHVQAQSASVLAAPANSVAVLPFANMSGDPKQEYFSDGFSEELLNQLSSNPHLRVPARTSSFAFKGKNADTGTIARTLGVRSVVEGSVREVGNHVRINAQLIDTRSGYNIWSATYDRNLSDILSLQDDIARAIAGSLTNHLVSNRVGDLPTMNAEAYRDYLQGRSYFASRREPDAQQAILLLQKAIALQPDFPEALATLSDIYVYLQDYGSVFDPTSFGRAKTLLARALTLAPNNLNVLAAHLRLSTELLDWNAATADANRMLKINPHAEVVLQAMWRYYHFLGFPDLALKSALDAAKLNPLSVQDKLNITTGWMVLAQYPELEIAAKNVLSLQAGRPLALERFCDAYALTGRTQEAQRIANRLPWWSDCRVAIANASGDRAKVRSILDSLVPQAGTTIGYTDLGLDYAEYGFYAEAVRWFNRGYAAQEQELVLVPFVKQISSEFFKQPGWLALMSKPRMRDWKAAHDAVAAQLEARSDPL